MNLRQIECFVQVAETGSFSRAAATLRATQPAISRQVQALEADLAKPLFHRNGRGVQLTDAGARFLEYARGVLHQLDGARHALSGDDADLAGRVVIGLTPSLGQVIIKPLVQAFRDRYRGAELAVVEALSIPLQKQVLAGSVDVAVIHNPVPSPLIAIEPILTESLCLLSAATAGASRPVPFSMLGRVDLIFPGAPHPIRSLIEAEAARRSLPLKVAFEIDAIAMILQLVAAGFGHAVSPYNVVRAGMSGAGIVARPIVRPRIGSTVALVTPERRPATRLVAGVRDILRDVLRATLQPAGADRGAAAIARRRP